MYRILLVDDDPDAVDGRMLRKGGSPIQADLRTHRINDRQLIAMAQLLGGSSR